VASTTLPLFEIVRSAYVRILRPQQLIDVFLAPRSGFSTTADNSERATQRRRPLSEIPGRPPAPAPVRRPRLLRKGRGQFYSSLYYSYNSDFLQF